MRSVEDVFDLTGRPPTGWMHALFDGGPFASDVGRCVPGPPPPDPLVVGDTTYRLRSVGSWSDPEDPIAIYGLTAKVRVAGFLLSDSVVLMDTESNRALGLVGTAATVVGYSVSEKDRRAPLRWEIELIGGARYIVDASDLDLR
jgi:hypothetical protein